MNDNELCLQGAGARVGGVTPMTITRWGKAGIIRSLKLFGGQTVYYVADIERVAAERGVGVSDGTT